ncbi:hypothetical protein B0H19DRAFT_1257437 [Mycena capillaripes]|nr:hypothetical protein B0H19DRAFT_1257437 [Mycena capillaripes]
MRALTPTQASSRFNRQALSSRALLPRKRLPVFEGFKCVSFFSSLHVLWTSGSGRTSFLLVRYAVRVGGAVVAHVESALRTLCFGGRTCHRAALYACARAGALTHLGLRTQGARDREVLTARWRRKPSCVSDGELALCHLCHLPPSSSPSLFLSLSTTLLTNHPAARSAARSRTRRKKKLRSKGMTSSSRGPEI